MTYTGALAKAELAALLTTALAGESVQVVYGSPWPWASQDVVSLGGVETTRTNPRMGPNRTADEVHQVAVAIMCARLGGAEQQVVCTERAAGLLTLIDAALRAVVGENISAPAQAGGIYLALIGEEIVLTETADDAEQILAKGRDSTIRFTVEVRTRRT